MKTPEIRMPLIPPTVAWIQGAAVVATVSGGGGDAQGTFPQQQVRRRVEDDLALTLANGNLAMMHVLVRQTIR